MKKIAVLLLSIVLFAAMGNAYAQEPILYGPDATLHKQIYTKAEETGDEVLYGPKIGVDFFCFNQEFKALSEEAIAQGKPEKEAHAEATRTILRKIAEMGYEGVQYTPWFAWWDIDAAELKALCDELGLEQIAPHYGQYLYWSEEEWVSQLAYLREAGINGITLDHNTPSQRVTGDAKAQITQDILATWAQRTIADIQYLFDHYDQYGYQDFIVGYHAHSWEFVRIRAYGYRNLVEIIYDTFGDKVILDLDTAWAATSHSGTTERLSYPWNKHALGTDGLVDYLWENGDMFPWIRLEDVNMETGYSAPLGQGDLEWDEIMKAAMAHGCEWFIVQDHDQAQYNRDIFESLQCSIDFLNELYVSYGCQRR